MYSCELARGGRRLVLALVASAAIHLLVLHVFLRVAYEDVRTASSVLTVSIRAPKARDNGAKVFSNLGPETRPTYEQRTGHGDQSEPLTEQDESIRADLLSGVTSVPAKPEVAIDLSDIPAPEGSGTLRLSILVDSWGRVREILTDDKAPPSWFVDAISDRFRSTRFIPAFRNGYSVPSVVTGLVEYQRRDADVLNEE